MHKAQRAQTIHIVHLYADHTLCPRRVLAASEGGLCSVASYALQTAPLGRRAAWHAHVQGMSIVLSSHDLPPPSRSIEALSRERRNWVRVRVRIRVMVRVRVRVKVRVRACVGVGVRVGVRVRVRVGVRVRPLSRARRGHLPPRIRSGGVAERWHLASRGW